MLPKIDRASLRGKNTFSYSKAKMWHECAYRAKLTYVDKEPRFSSIFSVFGTAIHAANEAIWTEPEAVQQSFEDSFTAELEKVWSSDQKVDRYTKEFHERLLVEGKALFAEIIPAFKKQFSTGFEIIATEGSLYIDIPPLDGFEQHFEDCRFYGIVDLVIKDAAGVYWLLDWKSCSWGWDSRKRSQKEIVYQLVLYKSFFAKTYDIPDDKVKAAFILLKRTAKTGNKVEFVDITSGPVRQKNALRWFQNAVIGFGNSIKFKNRLACKYCNFYKTELCP